MVGGMASGELLVDRHGHVLTVTLNRPDRLNAFDAPLMRSLRELWVEAASDDDLRCIVLTGAGRAFCAGADVGMLGDERSDVGRTWREELAFLPGLHVDVPVLAAVNGVCAGGGLHFVADADIAIAGESATFLDPHVSVGQVSALEPLTLTGRMRQDVLLRMVLLGRSERLDARQAQAAGLVSEVVPDDALAARAHELAEAIAANSPAAVRQSRRVLRELDLHLRDDALEEAWLTIRRHWDHPDAREGPAAFQERRAPRWSSP
jgi:enoyl-CoA hydratase/carnithine racemase